MASQDCFWAKQAQEAWPRLVSKIDAAQASAEATTIAWAEIAADAVSNVKNHADYKNMLREIVQLCGEEDKICPYTVGYLVQLAETYEKVGGNFNRGVIPSVLVEGRHHPDLIELVEKEPGMTVSRMKAHIHLLYHPEKEGVSAEEVEREVIRKRQTKREKQRKATRVEQIETWPMKKAEEFLPMFDQEATAYQRRIRGLISEGFEFSRADTENALTAAKRVAETLEEALKAHLAVAA